MQLRRDYWNIHREVSRYTKPLGLTPDRWILLLRLQEAGKDCPQSRLASLLQVQSVTLIVRKLIATGFVVRRPSPSDKRQWLLTLTDRAHLALAAMAIHKTNRSFNVRGCAPDTSARIS